MKKEDVMYQLLNYRKNRELLKKLPHIRYLDLAIVFYCQVENSKGEKYYALLTEEGREHFGYEIEELEDLAAQNTPRRMPQALCPLESLIEDFLRRRGEEEALGKGIVPMYVLTNEAKLFGAACLLYPGLLASIAQKLRADFYILPSSIHECILVPLEGGYGKEALRALVRDVNRKSVPKEEQLSNRIYLYRQAEDRIFFV